MAENDDMTMVDAPAGSQVTVKCSNYCGFTATGSELFCTNLYEEHEHQEEPDEWEMGEPRKWYGYVFSFWGAIIAIFICSMIVSIVTKDSSIF